MDLSFPHTQEAAKTTGTKEPVDSATINSGLWQRDNNILALILGVTFVSVYFLPIVVTKIVFLIFLVLAYRTKKYDYIWLIWFFIIYDAPGRLFSAAGFDDRRIPLYSIANGISFLFQELFLFMYITKVIIKKKTAPFIFQKEFNYFFIIIGLVFFYSFFIGTSPGTMVEAVRSLLTWAWVIIIPYYINSTKQIAGISRLLFPIILIALGLQIHAFITGNYLDYILRGVKLDFINLTVEKGAKASRVWVSTSLMLFALTQALFYLASKKKVFRSSNYLGAIVFTAIASIFLSATRGWILAFGLITLPSILLMSKSGKLKRLINLALASLVIIYILQMIFPAIRYQFEAALERFSTLELLLSGDVTAGGTLRRIDVRGKEVLSHFWNSPIIGWGFSDFYFEHADGHIGLQSMLLNVGIVGFVYLVVFYLYMCVKVWIYSKFSQMKDRWGNAPLVYLFSMLAIFLIHSSSTQCWGFIIHFGQAVKVLTISFVVAGFNALVVDTLIKPPEEESVGVKE